jgi:DNA-binding NtrC family response regulator
MSPLRRLVGESPGIVAIRDQVARVVAGCAEGRRLPAILIQGETGTGKGLLARVLHDRSSREAAPFVTLNCAALPDGLLEAELFGVERAAFTGADQRRCGLFQAAERGTLFLDEIGGLSPSGQAKLLTAIEEQVVRPVGGTDPRRVDVWIIAATSAALRAAVAAGRFREDLYHRLARIPLVLPPLRERGADITRLAEHFLARACAEYGRPAKTLGPAAREALLSHAWPGNVRELANAMKRVALLSDEAVVTRATLDLSSAAPRAREAPPPRLRQALKEFERGRILEALERCRWNVVHAAELLRIPRTTLRRRMANYRLSREDGPVPRSRQP